MCYYNDALLFPVNIGSYTMVLYKSAACVRASTLSFSIYNKMYIKFYLSLYMSWQRPMGLLALLDEESRFPRANDLSLAGRISANSFVLTVALITDKIYFTINCVMNLYSEVPWKFPDLTVLQKT